LTLYVLSNSKYHPKNFSERKIKIFFFNHTNNYLLANFSKNSAVFHSTFTSDLYFAYRWGLLYSSDFFNAVKNDFCKVLEKFSPISSKIPKKNHYI